MSLIGRKCPTFSKGQLQWLKGEPTDLPVPGSPTILELWATWCGPCRQVFPHLSKLQQQYADKGLRVVGVCLEDPNPKLKQFVDSQGDKMAYSVAVSPTVGQELMAVANASGIPVAFVVDRDGVIQFAGHPMDPSFNAAVKKVCEEAASQAAPPELSELPLITETREELSCKAVRDLKKILQDRRIDFADLHEKPELVDRILERCANTKYYA